MAENTETETISDDLLRLLARLDLKTSSMRFRFEDALSNHGEDEEWRADPENADLHDAIDAVTATQKEINDRLGGAVHDLVRSDPRGLR